MNVMNVVINGCVLEQDKKNFGCTGLVVGYMIYILAL